MEDAKHVLQMENRSRLVMDGISAVVSFRENGAELESRLGSLEITGEGLFMEKLDLERGEVILTGKITSLYYPDDRNGAEKGFFKRLFS
ncbi:MAG: sporulation protein YabP [Clostridia bacterium]|nr:sporulation protein YabP [Clostridia bacterium]